MKKALPKKENKKEVKKTPVRGSSSKKVGSGGKTRHTYPAEKIGTGGRAGRPVAAAKDASQGDYSPPTRMPAPLQVDPGKLAGQLGVSLDHLKEVVRRFKGNPRLKGREGFSKFWLSQARAFTEKHGLDGSYWGRVYDSLLPGGDKSKTGVDAGT